MICIIKQLSEILTFKDIIIVYLALDYSLTHGLKSWGSACDYALTHFLTFQNIIVRVASKKSF